MMQPMRLRESAIGFAVTKTFVAPVSGREFQDLCVEEFGSGDRAAQATQASPTASPRHYLVRSPTFA